MKSERSTIGSTERQLNLLSVFLKAREPLSWHDFARVEGYHDDGVATRSLQKRLERDIRALEQAGLKFRRVSDRLQNSYELDRGACLMPPLNLTADQRTLIFRLGMAYMQDRGDGPLSRQLSSALMKLQAGAGSDGLPARVPKSFVRRTLHRRPAETERVNVISAALVQRRRIRFRYAGRGKEAEARRTVAPYALVARRGGWYLIGFDVERGGERTFRLSRMRGEVQLAEPKRRGPEYDVPSGFDAERSFSSDAFGRGESAFTDVRIRFDAEVGFIIENEFAGIYDVRAKPDGSVTLHLPQAYPEELLRYLGEFPGHWEVQHPPELRKLVVSRLKSLLGTIEP